MRHTGLPYLLLFILLFIIGCDSDDGSEMALTANSFVAQKDDNLWEGIVALPFLGIYIQGFFKIKDRSRSSFSSPH